MADQNFRVKRGLEVGIGGTVISALSTGSVGIGTTNPQGTLQVGAAITMYGSAGIVSATKYYGDGSSLTGINAGVSISTNTTNQSQFLTYVAGTGSTTGFGVTTTGLVFNPSTTRLGIGTTNPRATLHVRNDLLVSTGTTASYDVAIKATTSDSGTLSFEDTDSTKQYFSVNKDTSTLFAVNNSSYEPAFIVNSVGNIGIGTTNPTSSLTVSGSALVTGISTIGNFRVTPIGTGATVGGIGVTYYGDASQLTGFPAAPAASVAISTNTTNQSQFLTYVAGTGSTAGFGVTTTGLVFNPSTTRLGIGTLTPRATLHVRNDLLVSTGTTASYDVAIKATTSDSGTLSFEDTDSTKQYFSVNKDTSTLFAVNNSSYEPAFIVGSGSSVGIGTTNPTSRLHVIGDVRIVGDANISGILTIGSNTFGSSISVGGSITSGTGFYGSGANLTNISASVAISTNTTNQSQFLTYVAGTGSTAGFGVTTTGLVFNPSTTRLGIGTLTPRATLHVRNDLLVSTGTTASYDVAIKATTSDSGTLSFEDTDSTKQYFSVNKDTSTLFAVNNSSYEPAFIVGSGSSVGIGTTNPTSRLHVQGSTRITGSLVDSLGATGTSGQVLQSVGTGISWATAGGGGVTIVDDTSTNATRYVMFDDATSGSASSVNVSSTKLTFNPSTGTLSATVFTSLSDANKKTNIRPIENAIEITKKLEGVRFDWIDTGAPSIGVIAQEVEKVLPELVVESDGTKSVSYGNIIGVLIEAIKEQQVRIEELERKLDA